MQISHLGVRTRGVYPGPLDLDQLDRPETGNGQELQLRVEGIGQLGQGAGQQAAEITTSQHRLQAGGLQGALQGGQRHLVCWPVNCAVSCYCDSCFLICHF